MGLVGLLNANRDFWAAQDAVVLSMSGDRQARLQGAQYRQLAETARATWAQAEIQHASFKVLEVQCRQLSAINGTLSATFDLLENTNTQLAGISGQLAETNEHLKGLRATQDENLLLIKRERTLKEVIFQLGMLIDSAVDKEDAVSAYAYHRYSLATLDRYQLGTADLSALEDKKEFDRFIKNSRTVVRNAVEETIQSLEDFEATYLLYQKRLEVGVVHDIPRKQRLPVFAPYTPPVFGARPVPEWQPRTAEPAPVLERHEQPPKRSLDEARRALKGSKPTLNLPECPVTSPPGGPPQPPETSLLPIGYVPPSADSIPTQGETDARIPPRNSLLGLFTYPKENTRARAYEDALRNWQRDVDAYARWTKKCEERRELHKTRVTQWEEQWARLDEEERHIHDVEYPQVLQEFAAAEEIRRMDHERLSAEYAQRLAVFQAEEEKRHAEHSIALEQFCQEEQLRKAEMRSAFELAEKQRFDEHCAEWRRAKDANAELEERLQQAVMLYENAITAHGRLINEYLDNHPDLQMFYRKVNPVADVAKYRRDWKQEAFGTEEAAAVEEAPVFCMVDWTAAERNEKELEQKRLLEQERREKSSVTDEPSSAGKGDTATTLRDYIMYIKLDTRRGGSAKCPVCKQELATRNLLTHLKKEHPQEADQPASKFGFFPPAPQSS